MFRPLWAILSRDIQLVITFVFDELFYYNGSVVRNLILYLAMFWPSSVFYAVVLSTYSPNTCYHINIKE
jgi:hypothetical protein